MSKYKKEICPNCKGTGEIPHYHYNCQGVCFRCNGTGEIKTRVYTEEELQKKNDRISKKHQDSIKVLRGFKNTDTLYIIAESNTYEIKEQLKQDGAIYNQFFKAWTFENDNLKDKYNLQPVTFEELDNIKIDFVKVVREQKKEQETKSNMTCSVDESLNDFFESLE